MSAAEEFTPTEDLVMELLAARHRCGETTWTLDSRHTRTVKGLQARGLVWWKTGIVEKSILAGLTDAGRKAFLSDGYMVPLAKQLDEANLRLEDLYAKHPSLRTAK